jgi:RecB family exonuclease
MERLDLEHPDPAALAGMATAELGLDEQVDPAALAGELAGMLDRFKASPLWEQLRSARRTWRELEFTALAGPAVLRGQIDLLYEDADGVFHLLDYKSDHVTGDLADYAQRYRLQMLLYAGAASRHLACCHGRDAHGTHGQDARATNSGPPGALADATLYFLRTAQTHVFGADAAAMASAQAELEELAGQLAAARRTGRYEHAAGEHCDVCPYGMLCSAR